jgi:hypothetical protein
MPSLSLSQEPTPTNITLRQNQQWNIAFQYTDSSGNLIDLTGYVPELQLRTSALAKTTALDLTTSNGITFNPSTLPQVQISAPMSVAPGKYEWDLKLTSSSKGVLFLGQGTIQVNADVTR